MAAVTYGLRKTASATSERFITSAIGPNFGAAASILNRLNSWYLGRSTASPHQAGHDCAAVPLPSLGRGCVVGHGLENGGNPKRLVSKTVWQPTCSSSNSLHQTTAW